MDRISVILHRWMGLCPKAPCLHTAPPGLLILHETRHPGQPDGSGSAAGPDRVRQGIGIAAGSFKALVRDREMRWFSLFSGILLFVLFALMYWIRSRYYDPWTRTLVTNPFVIQTPVGDFNIQLLLILTFCLFCFTSLMTGIILYRFANRSGTPLTVRERFARIRTYAGPLAALSGTMALAGTILWGVLNESPVFERIIPLKDAFLPYYNFIPAQIDSTFGLFAITVFMYLILFLALLYVVPVIALQNKGLLPALAGSARLMCSTWREMLGCILVFGLIGFGVAAIGGVIGQSHVLLGYDYAFITANGLQPIMTTGTEILIICFIILVAVSSTTAVVAIADLYRLGAQSTVTGISGEESLKRAENMI